MVIGDPATAPPGKGQVCTPVGGGRGTANNDLGADSMVVGYAQQLPQTITGAEAPDDLHTYIFSYIHFNEHLLVSIDIFTYNYIHTLYL